MNKEDTKQALKYFKKYSDSDYSNSYINGKHKARRYFHKLEDCFNIIIFTKENEVYQLNTDAEIFGVELKTLEDLKIRFTSFTGEKIENIKF